MGVLSKLTSTASNTITIGTVLAKTASIAALTALDTSLQTTKLFSDYAFGCAEDFVKVAEEVLETSGTVADHIANVAFVTLIMGAKLMPRQIAEAVKMLKILDDEKAKCKSDWTWKTCEEDLCNTGSGIKPMVLTTALMAIMAMISHF